MERRDQRRRKMRCSSIRVVRLFMERARDVREGEAGRRGRIEWRRWRV